MANQMGPPEESDYKKKSAMLAQARSKFDAEAQRARMQAEAEKRKDELSQFQHKNKMFEAEIKNYSLSTEIDQMKANLEAQQPVEQQQPPVPSMEEELAKMTPDQAMSIDPDSEDFKQGIIVGGEKFANRWKQARSEWAREQTRATGIYNQGSTKIDEQWYTPDQLSSRREALSRGTRSQGAIEHLNYLRAMAQQETAYNAGYRPPQMPPQEPFTLKPGETRYGQYGEPVATAPFEREEPSRLTTEEQRQEELIGAGLQPKAISDIERQQIESQIDRNHAEMEAKMRESGGLDNEDKRSATTVFRKEFNSLSSDYIKVKESYGRVQASVTPPSAAGDLALIFNYMKILDPGSVVRESEFANAAASGSYGSRIQAGVLKIFKGERLSPGMRADFVDRAKKLYKSQERFQDRLIKRYTRLSNRNGLNPQDVITPTGEFESEAENELAAIREEKAALEAKARQ